MIGLVVGVALALAASKWEGRESDVVAEATLEAAPESVYAVLLDDRALERILSPECATEFDYEGTKDPKATVRLTYHAAGMHRRLDALHSRSEPHRLVEIEHLGTKGFFTRWALEPSGTGTRVVMTTYLLPPPWPFRKYYYTKVRPAWVQCQVVALANLGAQAARTQ